MAFNDNSDLLVSDLPKSSRRRFPVGWTTRDQVLAFLGISAVDRFVVPQLILIDREGMIHYQTPRWETKNRTRRKLFASESKLLLPCRRRHRSAALHHIACGQQALK